MLKSWKDSFSDEFDNLMLGYGGLFNSGFILDQIVCVTTTLSGKYEDEPIDSFAGSTKGCTCEKF